MISTAILNALSDTMQVRVIGVSICMTDIPISIKFPHSKQTEVHVMLDKNYRKQITIYTNTEDFTLMMNEQMRLMLMHITTVAATSR